MQEDYGASWAAYLRAHLTAPDARVNLVKASGKKPNGRPVVSQSALSRWLSGDVTQPEYGLVRRVGEILSDVEGALAAAGYREIDRSDPTRPIVEVKSREEGGWDATLDLPAGQDEEITQADIAAAKRAAQATFEAVLQARKAVRQERHNGTE